MRKWLALGGAAIQVGLYVSPHPWDDDVRREAKRLGVESHLTLSSTDDLEADALRRYGAPGRLALASVGAGADLLILGRTAAATEQAARSLEAAARERRLPRAELEASAARVLALRRATAR